MCSPNEKPITNPGGERSETTKVETDKRCLFRTGEKDVTQLNGNDVSCLLIYVVTTKKGFRVRFFWNPLFKVVLEGGDTKESYGSRSPKVLRIIYSLY